MVKTAKSIRLYETEIETLLKLPEASRSRILTAILCDCMGEDLPELDPIEEAVFALVNAQVKRAEGLSGKRKQSANSRWNGDTKSETENANVMQSYANPEIENANVMQSYANPEIENANVMQSYANPEIENANVMQSYANPEIENANVMQNYANPETDYAKLCTSTSTNTSTSTDTGTSTSTSSARASEKPAAEKKNPPSRKPKPEKKQLAEFVSMTDEEYSSIVAKLGEQGAKRCVEILDNYKGANGKKYDSDYRAILNWVVERYEGETAKQPNKKSTPSSFDVEEIMRQAHSQYSNASPERSDTQEIIKQIREGKK